MRGEQGAEVTQRVPSAAYAYAGIALVCGACAFAQQQPSVSTAADECFAPPDARERTIELATTDHAGSRVRGAPLAIALAQMRAHAARFAPARDQLRWEVREGDG